MNRHRRDQGRLITCSRGIRLQLGQFPVDGVGELFPVPVAKGWWATEHGSFVAQFLRQVTRCKGILVGVRRVDRPLGLMAICFGAQRSGSKPLSARRARMSATLLVLDDAGHAMEERARRTQLDFRAASVVSP